jgi:hypothetical protein
MLVARCRRALGGDPEVDPDGAYRAPMTVNETMAIVATESRIVALGMAIDCDVEDVPITPDMALRIYCTIVSKKAARLLVKQMLIDP